MTAGCISNLQWKGAAIYKAFSPSSIPKAVRIAPSRNLLSKPAFAVRRQVCSDAKLQSIVKEQNLLFSETSHHFVPLKNHCVSMSLHFLRKYRDVKNIQTAANYMREGATEECAKTTAIYSRLFDSNVDYVDASVSNDEFLYQLRQVLAKSIDLVFSEEIRLHYPLERIFPFLEQTLPCGEYIIPLPFHVVAMVKDDKGELYLFDPNQGTIRLNNETGKKWFLDLLRKYRVHLTETLPLLKVSEYHTGQNSSLKKSEINFEGEKPRLEFENGKDRWGTAIFHWRGQTYRLPWDSKKGHIYNCDPLKLVRIKCLLLVPRAVTDTTIRIVYHVAMSIFRTLALPFALVQGKEKTQLQMQKIAVSVSDIFRGMFYGILGGCAAFYGIFKPFDGRRLYGYFERSLNRQNQHINFREKYYVAPCFTPCNFTVETDELETKEALKKLILRDQYLKSIPAVEMFFGWRHALPCFR